MKCDLCARCDCVGARIEIDSDHLTRDLTIGDLENLNTEYRENNLIDIHPL